VRTAAFGETVSAWRRRATRKESGSGKTDPGVMGRSLGDVNIRVLQYFSVREEMPDPRETGICQKLANLITKMAENSLIVQY
jgi:hypothetical protein